MTVFIDPSEGVLKLLTRRTSLVRKMAAARSMDNAEFRILYNNRVRLLRSKWDDSADPETIDGALLHNLSRASHEAGPYAQVTMSNGQEGLHLQLSSAKLARIQPGPRASRQPDPMG